MSIVNDSDEINYIKWFFGTVVHSVSGELAVLSSRDYILAFFILFCLGSKVTMVMMFLWFKHTFI